MKIKMFQATDFAISAEISMNEFMEGRKIIDVKISTCMNNEYQEIVFIVLYEEVLNARDTNEKKRRVK